MELFYRFQLQKQHQFLSIFIFAFNDKISWRKSHLFLNTVGTGVPIVLCGAKLAQQQILKDYGFIKRGYGDVIIISQYILFGLVLIALFLLCYYFLF